MPYKSKESKRIASREYASRPEVKAHRRDYHLAYRKASKGKLDERERNRRKVKRAQCLVAHARIRARKRGLAFDLDAHTEALQSRIDIGLCELTGLPFDLRGGTRQWASPSIDRIDPIKGYVIENVRVICYGMNAALGNWGMEPLLAMVAGAIKSGNAIVPQVAAEFIQAAVDAITDCSGGNPQPD